MSMEKVLTKDLIFTLTAGEAWFSASTSMVWGSRSFFPLMDLNDASKGFLLDDTIILEVEITTLSLIKK